MPDQLVTATTTCTAGVPDNHNNDERPPFPPPPRCNTCDLSLANAAELRKHMKEPWQYVELASSVDQETDEDRSVYNLKRRMVSMPSVSSETFDTQIKPNLDAAEKSSSEEAAESSSEDASSGNEEVAITPWQCLVCDYEFESGDDLNHDLDLNLEHMHRQHGLFIPNRDSLADKKTFLEYLATVVRLWHECLYCGAIKNSTNGVQSHMRDKGHCALNLEREPDLLEFWINPEEDDDAELSAEAKKLSLTEMQLPSGRLIGSRSAEKTRRPRATMDDNSIATIPSSSRDRKVFPTEEQRGDAAESSTAEQTRDQRIVSMRERARESHIVRRDELGLLGVSLQQRRALLSTVKRAQTRADMARRAHEWSVNRSANIQKYDLAHDRSFSKAKSGRHSMLPR